MTTKTVAQAIAHCKEVADKDSIARYEFDAIDDLVETPCASNAEFIEKLRFFCSHGQKISMAHPLARQRNLVTLPGRSRCIWRREHDNQT
jgi:hypothetical protein